MLPHVVAALLDSPFRVREGFTYALILSIAWVVFVPVLAPAIDHHYAEKQPGHGHIYPGSVPIDHSHPYETSHGGHDGSGSLNEASPEAGNGIVYLPPNDEPASLSSFNILPAVLALFFALVAPQLLSYRELIWINLRSRFIPHVDTPPPQHAL